jgi:23S rRNA (adenine2503-C2)-methyltransferase
MKNNIYNYDLKDLELYFESINEKKFRGAQVFDWLYRKRASSFEEMTNLKKEIIEHVKEEFEITVLQLETMQESSDGTKKYLFRLNDGNLIETVLMRHNYGNSVCVTTQIGCSMGCTFCASGQLGRVRNLQAAEIISQVVYVQRDLDAMNDRVSHIVVMGIGEPFDNYDNLIKFLEIINHAKGLEIGARHITVSTSGIVPKIYEFAEFGLQVNLAISLNAADNETRSKIMKINKVYKIEELIEAVRFYIEKTNRRITFEYILLDGMNDSLGDANRLSNVLRGLNAYVNLIPYNSVVGAPYKRTSKEKSLAFYDELKKRGINCTLRKEQGHDIDAACGQLRAKKMIEGKSLDES